MSLLAFLVVCGVGAVLGLLGRPSGRIGRWASLASLLAGFVAALFIGSTTRLTIGDVTLAGSEYSGRFLGCAAGSGLLLCVVALASGWRDELAPAALATFAGLAVATTSTDPGVALAAGAAAATAGALVLVRATPPSPDADGRLAEIRTIGLVTAGFLFAAVAILRPTWNGRDDGPVFAIAFFGLGLALAVRSGAVPFHVPAARMRQSATPFAPALLLVWIPAGLGIVAISWSATTFGIRNDWLNAAATAVQAIAVATIVLGALAALVHDELEEITAYSIVADAGFVLLALAARTDAAAEPARFWLLAFVAAKAGLVGWTAAVSRAFGTSNVGRLRGWMRRTPLLGLALMAIMAATLGWPGGAVYEARSTLIRLALPGWLQFLFVGAILLSIAYYGRLLVLGLLSPTEDVRTARSELPRWTSGPRLPNKASPDTPEPASTAEAAREPSPAAEPTTTPGVRRRFAAAWRINRTVETSLVVVIGAALALALAFGGLGATDASRFGIPLDTAAHATPTRVPPPTPATTPTSVPTLPPHSTALPSSPLTPSGSVGPSVSATPVKTAAPVRTITN